MALLLSPMAASPLPAGAQDSLRALLAEYRCPIVDRLDRIYQAGDPASELDRFLAVTVAGHPHGYVQCMFIDTRKRLLCEASSGFYYDPPGAPRTFRQPPEAVAALKQLGFDMDDSNGNFQIMFDLDDPPNFNHVADFMLLVLHEGYGARAHSQLRFNAPFAPRPASRCVPVS